jgi:hypothetical protein
MELGLCQRLIPKGERSGLRVYDVPAGGLAIGVGGFGSSGHSFYGGAGNVGGPLINHRVQAGAIYVR